MIKYDAVVVGAGNAGLAAALEFILSGKKTLLIEQHNLPGGCATSFCRGRFEFEPSLHELCGVGPEENPGNVRQMMNDFGVNVQWKKVDDCFRIISTYSDGSPMDVTMPSGTDEFIDKMEYYVPGSREKMVELFNFLDEIEEFVGFTANPDYDKKELVSKYPDVLHVGAYSTKKVLDAMNMPQKAIDILSVYWSYLGVDMERLSFFHYANMVHMYVKNGAYIPTHTSHEISNAMVERFRELGGDIWYNCRAEEFLFEGKKCVGVRTAFGEIKADYVLANINQDIIYGKMIPKTVPIPERELKLSAARNRDFGARMFTVYLGLNKTAEELGIKDYSIFLEETMDSAKDYENLKKIDTNNYSIFLCYNVANPEASPEGTAMCSFTTMYTASDDWNNIPQEDYVKIKNKIAKKIIDNFEKKTGIALTPYIEEISVATPWTFARYLNVPEGSVYGYITNDWDSILARILTGEKDYPFKGLKHIGTSGDRGDGYSSAYYSGKYTAIAAVKEMNGGNN